MRRRCAQYPDYFFLVNVSMSFPIELSPQERLSISRRAIVKHMGRHHPDVQERFSGEIDADEGPNGSAKYSVLSQIKYAARMWWHRHPASAVADLASPFLIDYARVHPFKLLGISAATGAALVIIRPWRMISGSALLIAAVKSSGLTNTLLAMLSSFARHSDNPDITL